MESTLRTIPATKPSDLKPEGASDGQAIVWSDAQGKFVPGASGADIAEIVQPTNQSPTDGATGAVLTPDLSASSYYSLYGKSQQASQWQVSTASDFATTVEDATAGAVTTHTVGTQLTTLETYYWRVRYQDADGVWSDWSAATSFTTADIYVDSPTITAPTDGATAQSLTPTITADAFNVVNGSDTHASSDWQIATDSGFSNIIWQSVDDTVNLESIAVPDTELSSGTTYYARVRYTGTTYGDSAYSTTVSFTTDEVSQPTITSPTDSATGVSLTADLVGDAFSVGSSDTHDMSDWEVATDSGFTTVVFSSYDDAANLTSITMSGLSTLTQYYARARYHGSEFGWSDWSASVSFTTADIYVQAPTNTSPTDTESNIGETPTLSADAFNVVNGSDTHASSDWEIYSDSGLTTLVWSSYDDASNLESITVPAGNLSVSTTYYWRCRYTGATYGDSEWSSATSFTTKAAFVTVYGIALVSTGGGAGSWQWVDADGNNITLTTTDFDNHPVWGNIADAVIDSQDMVTIPKFWLKTGTAPAGSDQAGKKCWWVGDAAFSGAAVHPAFFDGGVEIDQVYVGKYECTDDGGTKAGSVSGVAPLVSIDFSTMQTRCEARNEANGGNVGVSGFHLWGIYDLAAVQVLALIELGTPDVQSAIANGNVNTSAAVNTGTTAAVWRGIYELWGNVRHMTDGLQIDGSHQVQVWDTNGNTTLQSTAVTTADTDGWAVTLHDESGTDWDLGNIFLPATTDATEANGTTADYLFASDAGEQNICYHGGLWSSGSQAGLFFLALGNVASDSNAAVGGRLAKW